MKIDYIATNFVAFKNLNGKEVFLVEEQRTSISCSDSTLHTWRIPKGFISDLRSGPAAINWLLPKMGDDEVVTALIFLHDYMYCKGSWGCYSKEAADEFLVEGLRNKGYPGWKCKLIAAGLKLFGGSHFGKEPVRIWDASKQREMAL